MKGNKKALIITHIPREQPGAILDVLQKRGWQATIVKASDKFPSSKDFGVLIVMGGPQSANDSKDITPWMSNEITKIKYTFADNLPYLGVCLGMQELVKASGGKIIPSPRREVGFRESYGESPGKFYSVKLTEKGRKDLLFDGLPDILPLFHLHGESVDLISTMNPQATLLATGEIVRNQIVRVGNKAYGMQGHFELTKEMLEIWLRDDPDLLKLGQKGVEQVWADFEKIQEEYTKTAKTMFNNFFRLIEEG